MPLCAIKEDYINVTSGVHALIDGDILPYEFGSSINANGEPLAWPFVQARVDSRIRKILEKANAETYQIYLSSEDKSNFRYEKASIRPYKGNRPIEKPYWHNRIREFLLAHRGAQEVSGIEADDILGIEQSNNIDVTIICSLDKDLNMIPGWHYNWRKDEKYYIDEITGLRAFYSQLLTGDPVDNIPGLFGVGKHSSLIRRIDAHTSELGMYTLVKREYQRRFGSYWRLFLEENAILLWMLRSHDTEEVIKRIADLEERYNESANVEKKESNNEETKSKESEGHNNQCI